MAIREAIIKQLNKFLHPQTYSSLYLPRTRFNYANQVNGWQSSIIMACVGWIQRTYPEAPIMVQKRGTDEEWVSVPDSPVVGLLDNPNPYYDGLLLQSAFIADLVISGNAYLLKVRSGAGRTVQLWWTPSTLMEPKWPSNGSEFLSHYDYMPGGAPVKLDPKDVVHFRLGIDPDNLRKGRSPLQSLLREVFTDDEAANMTATLLRNMGVPGLLISPDKDSSVSPQDADAVKAYVKERTTGDRRGEPLIIGAPTHVEAFGFNPQQMDMKSLRRIPEERISACLGIPAVVAGLGAGLDRSTYSNMAEAREMAYESGIIPLQRIVGSQIKHQLLNEYIDDSELINWRVGYDLSEIRVLQEDEDKLSTRTIAQVNGGVCKVVDAQRILGLPEDDTQDFYLRNFNALTVRSGETGNEQLAPLGEGVKKKGGEGSGNFGHEGRPGEVGGSGEGGGISEARQSFIDNKTKVTGKRPIDVEGGKQVKEILAKTNIPDSHLDAVKSVDVNTTLVNSKGGMSVAFCDGAGNIVLNGKVGPDSLEHEIGHAYFQRKIYVRGNDDKYIILNAYTASQKTGKGFPSYRSRFDADEYFAESYAAYAQNSKALTKINPTMSKLLQKYWK